MARLVALGHAQQALQQCIEPLDLLEDHHQGFALPFGVPGDRVFRL